MKRLLYWAFRLAAVASTLLFVATCVLWMRSYWRIDVLTGKFGDLKWDRDVHFNPVTIAVYRGRDGLAFEIESAGGKVAFYRTKYHLAGPGLIGVNRSGSYPAGTAADARQFINDYSGHHALGCTFMRRGGREFDTEALVMPWPVAALAAALLPLASAVRLLSLRRKRQSGLCRSCEYDLTGNTSGTCPECGEPIHKGAQ